jgi:hypothetical protein
LIVDYDSALLLARYLIEDNSEDFVDFEIDLTQSLVITKSIFTKLVGNYKILSDEEESKFKEEIAPVIQKYKNSLKQHFDSLPSVWGNLSKNQILDTFIYMVVLFFIQWLGYRV